MRTYFDSSVLVAAALAEATGHSESLAAVRAGGWSRLHALAEAFSTLTGKLGVPAEVAVDALSSFTARLQFVELSAGEVWSVLKSAQTAGVRGGAIHDWLHVAAARAAGCPRWATYNRRHFAPHAGEGETVWGP